jgi:hypothetical protein
LPLTQFTGTSSCASASCHRMDEGKGRKGSEYSTWAAYDPHSKAYSVLYDPRSQVMARNYRERRGEVFPSDKVVAAHTDAFCLKCHSVNPPHELQQVGGEGEPNVGVALNDGVGCEGCHGGASLYRTTHYQDFFKTLSPREKAERFGLWPTKDLAWRTKMCATCHVGQKDMEVNHDLVAAGHPVLKYEPSGYHNIYPKHWPTEKGYGRDFQVRNWAIGQVVAAELALDLLAARADLAANPKSAGRDESNGDHPWPELAEYDCYACHKTIQTSTWRQEEGPRHLAKAGQPGWGVWYTPGLRVLAETGGPLGGPGAGITPLLDELTTAMYTPYPNLGDVSTKAKALRDRLRAWSATLQKEATDAGAHGATLPPSEIGRLLDAYLAHGSVTERAKRIQDWDDATQTYMALATFYQTLGDLNSSARNPAAEQALLDARSVLAFPPRVEGLLIDNPLNFAPKNFRAKVGAAGPLLRPLAQ